MAVVNPNRIYSVRAHGRAPVLNPVSMPDAAGAYLRGAVPAAGAGMPALRARLGDIEARAKERAAGNGRFFDALGRLVGVGADVARAYAGAVERRDEADLNRLKAAWTRHMTLGENDAWAREYARGGDEGGDGPKGDGPLVAIAELDRKFDETGEFSGARRGVRERFQEWRANASAPYYAKGQRLQADKAEEYDKRQLMAAAQAREAAIKNSYDLEDGDKWATLVNESVEAIRDEAAKNRVEVSKETVRAMRESYAMARYADWCGRCADPDSPGLGEMERELRYASMTDAERAAEKGKGEGSAYADLVAAGVGDDLSDEGRTKLRAMLNQSVRAREGREARIRADRIEVARGLLFEEFLAEDNPVETPAAVVAAGGPAFMGRSPTLAKALEEMAPLDREALEKEAAGWRRERDYVRYADEIEKAEAEADPDVRAKSLKAIYDKAGKEGDLKLRDAVRGRLSGVSRAASAAGGATARGPKWDADYALAVLGLQPAASGREAMEWLEANGPAMSDAARKACYNAIVEKTYGGVDMREVFAAVKAAGLDMGRLFEMDADGRPVLDKDGGLKLAGDRDEILFNKGFYGKDWRLRERYYPPDAGIDQGPDTAYKARYERVGADTLAAICRVARKWKAGAALGRDAGTLQDFIAKELVGPAREFNEAALRQRLEEADAVLDREAAMNYVEFRSARFASRPSGEGGEGEGQEE